MKHLKKAKEDIAKTYCYNKDEVNSPNILSDNNIFIFYLFIFDRTLCGGVTS